MAKIPTTYNTGMATQAQLQPVRAVQVPANLDQQIPQALANFGQKLEKATYELWNIDQKEEYQKNVADFKVQLADANTRLMQRKESLDNDQLIPEQEKASRFAEYAQAVQDDLFTNAPKHIIMDYKATYMNTVLPIQMQVQNNAQAAMQATAAKNIIVAQDSAVNDINAIAKSGGSIDERRKLVEEYLTQAGDKLLEGAQGLGGKARENIVGTVADMQAKGMELFNKSMLKETQSQSEGAVYDAITTFKNSPSALGNPSETAKVLDQIIMNAGASAGWDFAKIQQERRKAYNEIFTSSMSAKVAEADMQNTYGKKIAADTALIKQLTAVDKDGMFAYGGSGFDADKRMQFVTMLTNRIQSNREKQLAEARRSEGGGVGIGTSFSPLESAARLRGEKVVQIDLRNPATIQARMEQAQRLGVTNYVLTSKEANSLTANLLELPNAGEMKKWTDGITRGMKPSMRSAFINMMAGQVQNIKPEVSTTLSLLANNKTSEATTYYNNAQALKTSSDPTLKKNVSNIYKRVSQDLSSSGLPQSQINMFADVVSALSMNNPQFDYKKTYKNLVGENVTFNSNWNWKTNQKVFIPAGHNNDKVINWMNNPNTGDVARLGTTVDKVTNNKKVLTLGTGGYVFTLQDKQGNFVQREDGQGIVTIPLTSWFGAQ